MSRHRLYQNYDFQSELDDNGGAQYLEEEEEEEEDELSPEDKVQMAEGTAEVKSALGPRAEDVTTKQIQDALWHYYYDVDKSVAYLLNKFIDPTPKPASKPKPAQKSSAPSSDGTQPSACPLSIDLLWPIGVVGADSSTREHTTQLPPASAFFADMPWQNIPEERRTTFIKPPRQRGGLLGGASTAPKSSKLAALAAARKRKAEETTMVMLPKKENIQVDKPQGAPPRHSGETRQDSVKPSRNEVSKRIKGNLAPAGDTLGNDTLQEDARDASKQDTKLKESPGGASKAPAAASQIDGASDNLAVPQMAKPSAFAQVLCFKSAPKTPRSDRLFHPPWMAFTTPEAIHDAFEKPSPDDVVLAAQSQAGKKVPKPNKPNKDGKDVASDINKLKIEDATPLPKSKNLNVLKEYANGRQKKELSFVVVGHVDSGKSTLLGRLLLDMKVVDQRTIDKFRKEAEKTGKSSFALAWVLDSRSDERANGVTIDIATNHFETDAASFTLIDAPGHRDFIPNMLAGTSLADFAVLVVDAAKGAFEAGLKGQTREHALLLRSMGVFRIVVAINKLDTTDWSTERFEEIRDQVTGALKALKFPIKDISFVPVSGLKGENIVQRSQDPAAAWYAGPTLLEELEKSEPITGSQEREKPLRMMISDLWDTPLSPLTVSGRIDAGSLQVGDAVLVQPSREKAYIKTIERNDEPVDWAVAGQHVALSLSHIDEMHVHSGDVICSVKDPIPCVDTFTMRALAFDTFFPMPVDLHRGRFKVAAWIRELTATLDIQKGEVVKRRPQTIKAGAVARIRVRTEEARKVPLEKGQRVVLRNGGNTVAAGLIE